MGKIVKYCSTCEEGFSEKFSFCPNCASKLSAFEMKPVGDEASVADTSEEKIELSEDENGLDFETPEKKSELEDFPVEEVPEPEVKSEPAVEEKVFEPVSFESDEETMVEEFEAARDEIAEIPTEIEDAPAELADSDEEVEEIEVEGESSEPKAAYTSPVTTLFGDEGVPESHEELADDIRFADHAHLDDDYGITVINERSGTLRNSLLLGASALVLTVALTSIIWSIFNHPAFVSAIGDDDLIALLPTDAPIEIEEPPKEEDDDEGGGGGGGGKNEPEPASQGELPSQSRNPITPPSPTIPRLTDPDLKMKQETEGDIKRERVGRTGIPDSLNRGTSSGRGSGGGIGSGTGTGVGSGRGTGEGSGIGSGSGSGIGDGTGDGRGSGRGRRVAGPPPKPKPKGPTVGIQILSKPRPGYTDRARQNNVQGTVMLRVTFMANGRVGRISAVKGLPHGLTEKAIAAARQIRFKPAMRSGQAYSVTKRIQYNFTIY